MKDFFGIKARLARVLGIAFSVILCGGGVSCSIQDGAGTRTGNNFLCGEEVSRAIPDSGFDPATKQGCRYLDLDGDGVNEALVPLREMDPGIDPPSLYRFYGIARKNANGAWEFVKKDGAADDSPENLETLIFSCLDPLIAFDSTDGKRVFSVWNVVRGIFGFYSLTEKGVTKHPREQVLVHLRVGEIRFLKGLKVIPEQTFEPESHKIVALRLGEDGYISVRKGENFISIDWTSDTCGAKYNAFPMPLFSIRSQFRSRIAGVILHGKDEQRLGILFDENAAGTPDGYLYGSPADGNQLAEKRFKSLERYAFSKETDEKILTEFFEDDGRVCEGKPLPVIWFKRNPYGFHAVLQKK